MTSLETIHSIVSKGPYAIDHKVHDGIGHDVPDALANNHHVGILQVPVVLLFIHEE